VTRPTRSDTEPCSSLSGRTLNQTRRDPPNTKRPQSVRLGGRFRTQTYQLNASPYGTSRTQPQDASATVPEDAHRSRRCSCFPVELSTFGRRPKGARKRTSNCIASMSLKCHLRTWRESVREGPDLSENTHFNLRKSELILRQWFVREGQPSSWRHG
jgi:hypothetical protein